MEHPEERCKHKIVTIPNALSLFRLCLIPVIIWLYVGCQRYFLAMYILLLSGLTDIADGIIARKFNMVSDFGKAFDPIADKLTQIAILICLVSRFPNMLLPLVILVVKEIFIGLTSLLVIRKSGQVLGANWHGKVTTVLLYATMILHFAWVSIPASVSNILIGACTAMILVSTVLYGIRNFSILRERERAHEKS